MFPNILRWGIGGKMDEPIREEEATEETPAEGEAEETEETEEGEEGEEGEAEETEEGENAE